MTEESRQAIRNRKMAEAFGKFFDETIADRKADHQALREEIRQLEVEIEKRRKELDERLPPS